MQLHHHQLTSVDKIGLVCHRKFLCKSHSLESWAIQTARCFKKICLNRSAQWFTTFTFITFTWDQTKSSGVLRGSKFGAPTLQRPLCPVPVELHPGPQCHRRTDTVGHNRIQMIQNKAERERERESESHVKSEKVCDSLFLYIHKNLVTKEQTPRTTQKYPKHGCHRMRPASLSQVASQHHEEDNALQGRWDRFDLTSWIFLIHGPKGRWMKMNRSDNQFLVNLHYSSVWSLLAE